jgi:hypothetical protein
MSNIVRLQRAQIESAIAVLSRAFADDPLLSYFLPETEKARAKAIGQFYLSSARRPPTCRQGCFIIKKTKDNQR